MESTEDTLDDMRLRIAELQAENERLRGGGFSRRQLLTGGAGVVGAVAGAGLISSGRMAFAQSAPVKPGITAMFSTSGAMISVKITGAKQGVFQGTSEGSIPVLFLEYEVLQPRDAASGQATGRRQHKPLTMVKEWGAASPQIYQALATNEVLTQVVFDVSTPGAQGAAVPFFNITLTNAFASTFHPYLSDTPDRHNSTAGGLLIEEVSFVFQKIVWTSIDGKKSFQDSWTM